MTQYQQVFIDCMPGPTYHFGGHSYGNIASMKSANRDANPKAMALEWLNKIKTVIDTGAKQIVLPPHRRQFLRSKGTNDLKQLSSAYTWMANAGHFTPSCDTRLNSPIFTPSNMNQTNHRQKEYYFNRYWLKKLSNDPFIITPKLINDDEGAANTIRLSNHSLDTGLNIYITSNENSNFPSRQNKQSIQELINHHQINHSFILEQSKSAVDAGVFHNDVISFGFKNKLFCHQDAFENQQKKLRELNHHFQTIFNHHLTIFEVDSITLAEAIDTYLFNSQVIINGNHHTLLCPSTVKENPKTNALINEWQANEYFDSIIFIPLKESLMNGGGPACMRLTLTLNKYELSKINSHYFITNSQLNQLKTIVQDHYPKSFNIEKMDIKKSKYIEHIIESLISNKV